MSRTVSAARQAMAQLHHWVPEAPVALRELLASLGGTVLPPVRAEVFGPERFAQHGHSLGVTHEATRPRWREASFFPRLRSNIGMLRRAHAYIGAQAATGYDISPAAEWLLDNFHLIEAQLKAVHEGLPRSYFRALPVLLAEPLAGLPRVYGVAWAFVAHTDSAFDEALLLRFLAAYQQTRELSLSEMWALPTTLRVVLVENLRRLAERLATHKAARELANLCCDRIGQLDVPTLRQVQRALAARGVAPVFLAQMAQRLQDRVGGTGVRAPADVLAWLQAALPDVAAVLAQQGADQTADNLSVSNAVTSLRAIGDADWPDIVARTSALMRCLLTDPLFAAEDTATRDQSLHAIEALARRSGRSESAVAQTLLGLMRGADPDRPALALAHTAGHWLAGPGRAAMAQAVGLATAAEWGRRRWQAWWPRLALPLYLATVLALALAWVWWALPAWAPASAPGWWRWVQGLLGLALLGPASEAAVALVNRLISESARPRHLPRLALATGIPAAHRVLVVVPALINRPEDATALWHRLRLHHLANPEAQAQFALLSDWADAPSETLPGDAALLDDALAQLAVLNALHPVAEGPPRFVLLHRRRRFSQSEQAWMGWERKRGKLEQLLSALATGDGSAFLDLGEASRLAANTPYVLTLDADTQLPPGRLRELVGVAAHPQNTPQLDAAGRRVVAGHAILQPRLATPLPAAEQGTLFHTLFAGHGGVDPYSAASSEVYQDLFGEGSFTGKGLLHVAALHRVLGGRLPEDQVLSHDLLEGCLARCAAVTDVTLLEDAPFHADVAAARLHRWTRGDWQLLPVLLQPRRYPLSAMHRWKLLDNLRRSMVAPLSLAAVLLVLSGLLGPPWAALALVLAAYAAGPLMGAVAGFAPSRDDIAKRHFYRQAAADLLRALWGALWHGALLLQQAGAALDAIGRALWRLLFSHRHLLQWTTAAAAQAAATLQWQALWRQHRRSPAAALLLWLGLVVVGLPWPALSTGLCLVWGLTPLWVALVSRPWRAAVGRALPPVDRAYLQGVARDTWRYFERSVTEADHHLPPDNLQTTPHEMLAHRTSPTNIGLYLLSVACAQRFGWISLAELLDRVEATLASVARLERHRGHLLNWYDTQTLQPLLPRYVSTVDSGNLSGHLLALAQACMALAEAHAPAGLPPTDQARLLALAVECERLAWRPDFGFLYHRKRHLLHIGYRVAEQQLDAGFYDLLASESRLTSLLAIAKGDVPVRHWAALGRPFYAVGAVAGLRSWSGSMFEYLMPSLVLDEPPGSVLSEACKAALQEQRAYVATQGLPWGISESAYAGCDHTLAYQYAPQGVPRLALRRTPPDELVIAPYASALAAQIAPHRATLNLAALQALGARGSLGFIEALDYTPSLQTAGGRCTPVNTFMAHHQGMTLVALANVLLNGEVRRWGMANAHLAAVASLLHERAPREVSQLFEPPNSPRPQALVRRAPALLREVLPGQQAVEPTQLLSNGRYSVTLRANGAGGSRLGAMGLNRGRDDALRDALGSFFYLRRLGPGPAAAQVVPWVSLTQQPAACPQARYSSVFHADRVCFEATWPDLQAQVTVWVSPEDDIEFRQVELRNLGDEPLTLELCSAFEVTLATPRADEAHPAFSGLFVRAVWQAAQQALVFERRPRLVTETGLQLAHFLAEAETPVLGLRGQTDRARWLGRNRAAHQPLADLDALSDEASEATDRPPATGVDSGLDGESEPLPGVPLNTGLDPVCALALRVDIAPQAKAQFTFATAASTDSATLRALVDKYRQASHVQRASLMSATLVGIRLRTLRLSAENFAAIQWLTTALVMGLTRPAWQPRGDEGQRLAGPTCDRRLLWRLGISGDRPLLLVSAGALHGIGLLRTLAQALRLWAWGGIACDLVVVNAEPASYLMALHREIGALRDRHASESGGSAIAFHLLRADDLSAAELATLQAQASLRLVADGRGLLPHVQAWLATHEAARQARATRRGAVLQSVGGEARVGGRAALPASSGVFAPGSGAFGFAVGATRRPPKPWINVLANAGFGSQVSDGGGGCTWALNSRLHQLTAWRNDPVADPPGEWLLLQDLPGPLAMGSALPPWSATPSAWGAPAVDYQVSHEPGLSTFSHQRGGLVVELQCCVDLNQPVKQWRLRLHNRGTRTRVLRLVMVVEWLLGERLADRHTVVTTAQLRQGLPPVLLATQQDAAGGFGGATAWLSLCASAEPGAAPADWTCDRREFFNTLGQPLLPEALGHQQGPGLDPCAALSNVLTLTPGQRAEHVWLLGHADSAGAAQQAATAACQMRPSQRVATVQAHWQALLGATTVTTPDPLFDALVNRWLLYQTVSCRLWAKAGFYQAGGATGFRDQLQDTLALAWAAPQMLRAQIVLCASRQFVEGDVQHWWHAPGGAGVRTHFSDDLLWLPHALLHYLRVTGDTGLMDEVVPFLQGGAIPAGAEDLYEVPSVSTQQASVYEHAARALDRSLRKGVHGLPLMGSGDWNDGMNRVGIDGRGESVWLAWFLLPLVRGLLPLAAARRDTVRAMRWTEAALGWRTALQGPAWDGDWYRRAFFDDGSPLGAHGNAEARIDLIAQAWAVLSGEAPVVRQQQAMASARAQLVDPANGLLRLLNPPLAQALPSAGYIQAYPPGVRENGGQYSHAGVWALMAQAALQRDGLAPVSDLPYQWFTWLSPAHRAAHPQHGPLYGLEPYAVAGDVCSQPPHTGHGGWSWYTGAAAWLHRAAVEALFGLDLRADSLQLRPCLPAHWARAEVTLQRGSQCIRLVVLQRPVAAAAAGSLATWPTPWPADLPAGARPLQVGEALAWPGLPPVTCFVLQLA